MSIEARRVVVTGMGVISSVGTGVPVFWDAIKNGEHGITRVTKFDPSAFRTQMAGEVKDFDFSSYMPVKEARRVELFCQYAIVAGDEALKQAGLPSDFDEQSEIDPGRVGVVVSSGIGGLDTMSSQSEVLQNRGPGRVSPFLIPMMIIDMASGTLSMRYHAKGPNMSVVTACGTACHSIGESFWMVKRGDADVMITGGAEATICPLGFAGFCSMKAMSQRNDDPDHASRPFDKERDGFVMAEGSGVLVLEELEHAKKRGANILAEIVGYGATGDAYHVTSPAPGGEGAARAIKVALDHAKLNPEDIDYINAHGTSTPLNDKFETQAIKAAFGNHAGKLAVSSTKGATGHGLGAAGGLESAVCVQAIRDGVLPPTLNYEVPDPELDLDYVPNEAREKEIKTAVNINLGFGGHNGVLIYRKYT